MAAELEDKDPADQYTQLAKEPADKCDEGAADEDLYNHPFHRNGPGSQKENLVGDKGWGRGWGFLAAGSADCGGRACPALCRSGKGQGRPCPYKCGDAACLETRPRQADDPLGQGRLPRPSPPRIPPPADGPQGLAE